MSRKGVVKQAKELAGEQEGGVEQAGREAGRGHGSRQGNMQWAGLEEKTKNIWSKMLCC